MVFTPCLSNNVDSWTLHLKNLSLSLVTYSGNYLIVTQQLFHLQNNTNKQPMKSLSKSISMKLLER